MGVGDLPGRIPGGSADEQSEGMDEGQTQYCPDHVYKEVRGGYSPPGARTAYRRDQPGETGAYVIPEHQCDRGVKRN
jgi:hypothetical protein